jgi:hypothetical protein
MHPFEAIQVNYVPPKKPEHIVETRYIRTGEGIATEGMLIIDGVCQTHTDLNSSSWSDIVRWMDQTKAWKARESFGNPERYDAMQIARMRREKVFGPIRGEPTTHCAPFETWLMDNGWRPIMLDALNAYCPGRILVDEPTVIIYTHIFTKGSKSISMQFGYGPTNFVFMLSWISGTFQIPVDSDKFNDAICGLLPNLDA